jgi:hypothetical protein
MSIWNKILIGFIFIAAAGLFYMSARSLKTHETWRLAATKHRDALKQVLAENEILLQGSDAPDAPKGVDVPKGIVQLKRELHRLQVDRGRVWRKCDARSVAAEGAVKIGIPPIEGVDKQPPHGITAKMKVYLFEGAEGKDGGKFLGEFVATEVGEREVGLQPTRKLTAEEIQLLNQAQGRARQSGQGWTAYEEMPTDEHGVFAGMKEDALRAVLPEGVVREYVKDGQPAEASDPEERRADGKYARRLRDYSPILERYSRARTELADAIESGKRDKQGVEEAVTESKAQEEYCRAEVTKLKEELGKATAERNAVVEHLKRLDTSVAQQLKANTQAIELNQAMAAEITRHQLEAARLIDRRTGTMAQAGSAAAR